jgi:tetratricopeptide (TPR) repeat protein
MILFSYREYDKAADKHRKSLAIATDRHDATRMMYEHFNVGNCYFNAKRFDDAEPALLKALEYSRQFHNRIIESRSCDLLHSCASKRSDWVLAQRMAHDGAEAYESLNKSERSRALRARETEVNLYLDSVRRQTDKTASAAKLD